MQQADLVPPADRWTIVIAARVMASSKYQSFRAGKALMADGSGRDVPVLSFTYASNTTATGRALRPLLVDTSDGGLAIGFGSPRHTFLVGDGPGWRPAGELVATDGGRVASGADHRYGLVVDGVTLGELGTLGRAPPPRWSDRRRRAAGGLRPLRRRVAAAKGAGGS